MSLALLIPISILMGLVGLGAFFWAMRGDQFDDPEGAAWRVLDPRDPMEEDGQGLRPAPDEGVADGSETPEKPDKPEPAP